MLDTLIGYVYELSKIVLIFACIDNIIDSIGMAVAFAIHGKIVLKEDDEK